MDKNFFTSLSSSKSSSKSIKYLLRKKKIYCLHVKCGAAFRIKLSFSTAKWIKYLILCMDLEEIRAVRTLISRLQVCASLWVSISLVCFHRLRELNFFLSPLKYFPVILSMCSHDKDHFSLWGNEWFVHLDVHLSLGKSR